MLSVGVVGGTGYTGLELLRLLAVHPGASLDVITSRGNAGTRVDELFPGLRNFNDLVFTEPKVEVLAGCDVVFFSTPNGVAMSMVPELLKSGTRVIDLAADFRLKDPAVWKQWYGMEHACPELLGEAVYGLPEVNRTAIKHAQLVACPGCYPTAIQLGFLPLIEKQLVDSSRLIADAKSGVSGAGRQANVANLLCEVSESFKAYAVTGHRHIPEIEQGLNAISSDRVNVTFTPHLTPMIRGIHATLYAELKADVDLQEVYESRYAGEAFVDVLPEGSHPDTRSVKGANMCRIAVHYTKGARHIVILSVIDNLVKGAAGQAIQNMNLMFDQPEQDGLVSVPFIP
ncbi:MAG TPA: N-acetyl-gamma-glutamyl-phosphate reductase [Gammaproteobacteria bacterium]|nr:N-acetyl-gamma-glutamyl-phosphate reductase [Gammaproteobacteria bacterium]